MLRLVRNSGAAFLNGLRIVKIWEEEYSMERSLQPGSGRFNVRLPGGRRNFRTGYIWKVCVYFNRRLRLSVIGRRGSRLRRSVSSPSSYTIQRSFPSRKL